MENILIQKNMTYRFVKSVEREELLKNKCGEYIKDLKKNSLICELFKKFIKASDEHTKMLNEKMIKLNIN